MSSLPSSITAWLAADSQCQAGSPQILAFINQYLPSNYKQTMKPYDTARTLQRAVTRSLLYSEPPAGPEDAVNGLAIHQVDCGGYAALLTAALRTAGIPARRISGWWNGDGWPGRSGIGPHVRTEFYLPVTGWLITDSCLGNSCDPTSIYSPDFCSVPDAGGFIALDTGDAHITPYGNLTELQMTACSPQNQNYSWLVYLEPLASLASPVVSGGSVYLTATNMPSDGWVKVQQSTSLSGSSGWTTITNLNPTQVYNNWGQNYPFLPIQRTVYVGNTIQGTGGADADAPLVILGEYSPSGPSATASSKTTLPAGTVQDVQFYGGNYNFTLYALAPVSSGPGANVQTFRVDAYRHFSGTFSPGPHTLSVTGFPVKAGDLLAFAGTGPYYPQSANDAPNSDATYENSSPSGTYKATAPSPGAVFTVGPNPDPNTTYEYIPNAHQNQGRTYAIGVDVLPAAMFYRTSQSP
jgi:hypothetical protein